MNPFLTIKELRKKILKREINIKELVNFYSNRLKKYNQELNATLDIFDLTEKDFNTINNTENNIEKTLLGIPGLLKDNICQKDKITSASSKILSNYKSPYNATVTKRLKNAGAFILGRTNSDEFAMGASGEYSAYKITKNPWDKTRTPGGSSSGSAAAVAAGLVPWALGSETGGSVRQPASFSGLVGLYPTYGLFSRYGLLAFASSLDQVGPLTKTVYDNALITSTISGYDHKDSTSLKVKKIDYTKSLDGKLPEKITLGVIKDALESEGVDSQIKNNFKTTITQFEKLGAKIKYIELPNLKYAIPAYFIISRAEAASNLSRYDGSLYGFRKSNTNNLEDMYLETRDIGFGSEVKKRILMGNYVLSALYKDAFYNKANILRDVIRAEFENALTQIDLLISPTTSTIAFELNKINNDPIAMYMADYFTIPTNIAGLPALSIPSGFSSENLPIGVQLIGPRLSEELIYKTAYAFEQSTQYYLKTPPNFN